MPLPLNASSWHRDRLHLRLAGARAAVDSAQARLGGAALDPAEGEAWWNGVRDHTHPFFAATPEDGTEPGGAAPGPLWRLSLPPTTPSLDLPGERFIEWHGAQRWIRTDASALTVRAAAVNAGGHATLFRGGDKSVGVFTPLAAPLLSIHRGLKQAFDPAGVFNPGRLYADL